MFYYIYKITNTINGKIYVGVHKTKDLEDGYMGSGKVLNRAIKKYGLENFTKEVINHYDNSEDMFNAESQLVNEEFVSREDTYNLKVGGFGGWDYINSNEETRILKNRKARINANKVGAQQKAMDKLNLLRQDEVWKKNLVTKCKESRRKSSLERYGDELEIYRNFTGKSHSDETKKKIGEANSKHQLGKGNSQFGTMWIYNLEEKLSKKIKKEDLPDYEKLGWLKGRKIKF